MRHGSPSRGRSPHIDNRSPDCPCLPRSCPSSLPNYLPFHSRVPLASGQQGLMENLPVPGHQLLTRLGARVTRPLFAGSSPERSPVPSPPGSPRTQESCGIAPLTPSQSPVSPGVGVVVVGGLGGVLQRARPGIRQSPSRAGGAACILPLHSPVVSPARRVSLR